VAQQIFQIKISVRNLVYRLALPVFVLQFGVSGVLQFIFLGMDTIDQIN